MKTFRLLALLPLISGQLLLGQTTSPVTPDSTTGSTSVNFTGANANKGAGEDTSSGGTGLRIPVDSQGRQAAAEIGKTATAADGSTTGIVTSGMTAVPTVAASTNAPAQTSSSTTNTTNVTGTTPGTR